MTWHILKRWRLRRHLKKHARERKELEDKVLELERIKRECQSELEELEYHHRLWNSVQREKPRGSGPRPPFPRLVELYRVPEPMMVFQFFQFALAFPLDSL